MSTSGTYNFSMDIDEVIQEALEMIGGEQTLGNDPKSARRSINLLLQDWQNRGILLWSTNTTVVDVSASVTAYSLSSNMVDAMEVVVNLSATDIQLDRISMEEYLKIPRKSQTGRPTQYAIRRGRSNPELYLWPVPDNNDYSLKIEKIKYLQDVNKSAGQIADVSRRFLPCMTAGVAYFMSLKRAGIDGNRIMFIKQEYEERLARAMDEDRERTSLRIVPKLNLV
jgi:hypothetical protein